MPKNNVTPYTTSTASAQTSTKVHQSLLAFAMCLTVLLTPACSPGDSTQADDPPSTRSTTTTAEPTTTTLSTQSEVQETYMAFVAMLDRITTTTVDPNDPELEVRLIDPALSDIRTRLSTWQAQGQIWLAGDLTRHRVETVFVSPNSHSAVVTDCVVENDVLVQIDTSAPFPIPRTTRVRTSLVNQGDAWMVRDSDEVEHWEGVAGCAG